MAASNSRASYAPAPRALDAIALGLFSSSVLGSDADSCGLGLEGCFRAGSSSASSKVADFDFGFQVNSKPSIGDAVDSLIPSGISLDPSGCSNLLQETD
jgi:hypothetical protein